MCIESKTAMSKTAIWQIRNSVFLDWFQLKELLEYRIEALIGRNIRPVPFQDGDYWDVRTDDYTQQEIDVLIEAANGDEYDQENHPVDIDGMGNGLNDTLARKLIAVELPFEIDKTLVGESGVYFLSNEELYTKVYK